VSAERIRVATAAATDVGRKRSGNEDSYAVQVMDPSAGRPEATLLVVCDGMGGTNAGEVASRMTVDTLLRSFEEDASADTGEALGRAIQAANTAVWEHNHTRADLQGMGTTCTALALGPEEAVIAHVGDSRAYLVRAGRIRQLTQDHSLVAQLVARKQLTPEEAKRDPRRNVITRSVGISETVEPDVVRMDEPLRPGDTFLLCSDGLHGQVSDQEMARIAAGESLERACRELIRLGNEHGGPDNLTVLLARLESPMMETRPQGPSRKAGAKAGTGNPRKRTLQLLLGVLIVLLLTISGLAWVVFGMMHSGQKQESSPKAGETSAWH
jgi:serine/threonine protein phosphatase PrpC